MEAELVRGHASMTTLIFLNYLFNQIELSHDLNFNLEDRFLND